MNDLMRAAHNTPCLPTWWRCISKWHIKKLLAAMFKIFHESPSRRVDLKNMTGCGENDYPLKFCVHRWIENEVAAGRGQVVWPKLVEVVRYWQALQKSKQPGQGKPDGKTTYQRLASSCFDVPVALRLAFLEEVAKKLNKFFDDSRHIHYGTFHCWHYRGDFEGFLW